MKCSVLILACGNTLRSDDGFGPWLCEWAAERFSSEPRVRAIARQQWTPDLAQDIAEADAVVFLDCSIQSPAGMLKATQITCAPTAPGLATHHTGAAELLGMASKLFGRAPGSAVLLTVGAGSIELGEQFSASVKAVLPEACDLLESTVRQFLS